MQLLKELYLTLIILGLAFFLAAQVHAEKAPEPPVPIEDDSNIHFQATTVTQYHPGFSSPYSGPNSLSGGEEAATSFTSTLFLGRSLWKGAAVYVNPEVSAGQGLRQTHGIAGFPNGEIYRVDSPGAKLNLSRLFVQHVFGLGGDQEKIEDGQNQLARSLDQRRITVVAGKFSLNDFFDDNTYSHDPRTQFFNWSLMDNAAWDYAADTRGYSWGFYFEFNQPTWAVRAATVMVPKEANQLDLDLHLWQAFGDNLEFEYRYRVADHPGKVRFLSYLNRAHMGSYSETLANPIYGMDVTQTRDWRTKYGFGLNLEQELTPVVGAFMRAGWNNGTTETWAFTEVDRTISAGVSVKGDPWHRASDTFGVAGIINGLSQEHALYLAAGGLGFMLGDGALSYAPEQILETYYSFKVINEVAVSADFQYVGNPGYNGDRGPAEIYSVRLHCEL